MERRQIIGLGAFGALIAASLVMASPKPAQRESEPAGQQSARAHLKLASLSPTDRTIDYIALDARLQALMRERSMVGLAVGVVENGRITFLDGYGETVAGTGERVQPDTVFRWASVSKGVAATMVAKLAEQGKVDLNAPIANYSTSLHLPSRAEYRATVGDMLSHRLGLYRNAYDNKLEEGQGSGFLRQALAQLNLICPPGTCWSYQNVAYDGATEIVERQTGKSYERAVRETLFGPIGMTSASISRAGLTQAKSWARPHTVGRRPVDVADTYYRVPAAGGVNSNIKDMALWMIAQMGEIPDVLSPRLLETIHAPIVQTPGERRRMRKFLERVGDPYYGYGWRSYNYAGHRIVGHHGGVNGYRSLIMFDPAKKSGVVAMWNSNTSQPWAMEFEVMDMIYGLPFRDWMDLDGTPRGRPVRDELAEQGSRSIKVPQGRRRA
ncbi:MAG TPA: serine hydrolase domain-containing protein [Sphingomicrobium sp.]|nr:serine hydrolase domain-containing protein [Sphingomicrobium sp.]